MVGTFIEEAFSPLPSFLVLVPAGAAAHIQGLAWWYLGVLALWSGIGRIAGATLLYWLADRFEDVTLRDRRFFGVSHKDVVRFGERFGKSRRRDWFILFLMNAIPIFPTAILSLTCGFLKVPLPLFATATFCGTLISAVIYLYIGYGGIDAAGILQGLEFTAQVIVGMLVIVGVVWLLRRHRAAKRQASLLVK